MVYEPEAWLIAVGIAVGLALFGVYVDWKEKKSNASERERKAELRREWDEAFKEMYPEDDKPSE